MNFLLIFFEPFAQYEFMQRALLGSFVTCLGAVPVGVFMTLRRMSLTGEAMAHAILPGAAIAYLLFGMSLIGMTLGGLLAGSIVVALSGWVARSTHIKEDTSLAAFCLISLSLGVLILSVQHSNVDLFHVLFGNILALDNEALLLLGCICSISLLLFSLLFRPLVIECVDPLFLRREGIASAISHYGFLFLMVINLVAGFHAVGTLLAIGIMILPAAAARFWVNTLNGILLVAVLFSFFGCYLGLLISYYYDLPAGPTIIMSVGTLYIFSLFIGLKGGCLTKLYLTRYMGD
jgi:zinc/manganese transport system permease protein